MSTTLPAIGLQTVLGAGEESAYGTPVVPGRFTPFTSESMALAKTILQDPSLYPGPLQASRSLNRVVTGRGAAGDITLAVRTGGMGLFLKHLLGTAAAPAQQGGTPAYLHRFTPGLLGGKSLTIQKQLRNNAGALVGAFDYPGSKITKGEFSIETNGVLSLTLSVDARNEVKQASPPAASYDNTRPFHFAQGTLKLRGTTVAQIVKSAKVAFERPMDVERIGIGNQGLKGEPSENAYLGISGEFATEFVNYEAAYDSFSSDEGLSFELEFLGEVISGSYRERLTIAVPDIHLDGESPKVSGPGTIPLTVPFTGLYNGTDQSMSIEVVSRDVTV